jgi:hypothetical protein
MGFNLSLGPPRLCSSPRLLLQPIGILQYCVPAGWVTLSELLLQDKVNIEASQGIGFSLPCILFLLLLLVTL